LNGFSFFQPVYLWGIAAVALPLLLHLLSRKRTKELDFSTVRFFENTALRASKIRRLRRLLLLLARLSLLVLLACIFAKPYNRAADISLLRAPGSSVYCWIDPTKSMEYAEAAEAAEAGDGADAAWQKARALVDTLGKALPASSRLLLFDESRGTFVENDGSGVSGNYSTRWGPPRIEAVLREFKEKGRLSGRMPVLLVVSDFQKNICVALDSFFQNDSVAAPFFAVSVGPENPWNIGVGNAFATRGQPGSVKGNVSAVGKDFKNIGISVVMNGMRVCQENVSVKKNGTINISMTLPAQNGQAGGMLKINAADPFVFDNTRYFVRSASSSFRVLVVGDSSACFPIAAALHSVEKETWMPIIVRRPEKVSYDDIDSSDVVVLNELTVMPRALQIVHGRPGFQGKAVIISPAIDSAGIALFVELLRGFDKKNNVVTVTGEKSRVPVLFDTVSPLWKGFPRLSESGCAVYRYIRPLPGNALLNLDNGEPLATYCMDSSRNAWVFFATPLGITAANNLSITGMYLPCLDRIIRYALESIHGEIDEWIAGKPRRNPFYSLRRVISVFDAHNNPIAEWNGRQSVVMSEPGLYRIQPAGLSPVWVAVNGDSEEISLDYSQPTCTDRGNKNSRFMGRTDFLYRLKKRGGLLPGYALWCLLAVFLIAEMFFWQRPLGKDGDTEKKRKT